MTDIRHRAFSARSNRILEEGSTKEQIAQGNEIEPISQNNCAMTILFAKQTVTGLPSYLLTLRKRCAFTLAEVLITLGVIGVVAALTLPSVINKYRSQVLHKQFLKAYSNISQSILLMKNDLGVNSLVQTYAIYDPEAQRYPYIAEFNAQFHKYFKVVDTVPSYSMKNYSNTKEASVHYGGNDHPRVTKVLADGTGMDSLINSGTIILYVDTNGPKKSPNRLGFDIFEFRLNQDNDMVVPVKQYRSYTDEELETAPYPEQAGLPCSKNSKQAYNGKGCSWYAVNDINPDDETKKYWDSLPW